MITQHEVEPAWRYFGLQTATELNSPDAIEEVANRFRTGAAIRFEVMSRVPPMPKEEIEVLTEFDATVRHFSNAVPLTKRPWSDSNSRKLITEHVTLLLEGTKSKDMQPTSLKKR